ncbi:MAG: hypothetical protein SGPRY_007665, partial [Prymnesium sp.]
MEPLVDSELLARAAAIAGRGELPSPRALPSACPIPLRALSQAALPPSAPRNDAPNPPLPSSVALHVDHAFFDDSDDELAYVDPTPHRTPAAFPSARFAERGNRVLPNDEQPKRKLSQKKAERDCGGDVSRSSSGYEHRFSPPAVRDKEGYAPESAYPPVEGMQIEDPNASEPDPEAEISMRFPGTNKVLSLQLGGSFASAFSYINESASLLSQSVGSLFVGAGHTGASFESSVDLSQQHGGGSLGEGLSEAELARRRRDEHSRKQAARFREQQQEEEHHQRRVAAAVTAARLEREVSQGDAEDVRMGPFLMPSPFLGQTFEASSDAETDGVGEEKNMTLKSDGVLSSSAGTTGFNGGAYAEGASRDTHEDSDSLSCPSCCSALATLERGLLEAAVGAAQALRPIFDVMRDAPPDNRLEGKNEVETDASSESVSKSLAPKALAETEIPGLSALRIGLQRLDAWIADLDSDVEEVPEGEFSPVDANGNSSGWVDDQTVEEAGGAYGNPLSEVADGAERNPDAIENSSSSAEAAEKQHSAFPLNFH